MGRPRTTRTSEQVTIRLPEGMRDELNRIASMNGRSANAEIVNRLERSLSSDELDNAATIRQVVREEMAPTIELLQRLAALLEKKK